MSTKKPPLESTVVKRVLAYLNSRGGFWMKVHGGPFQLAGVPDIIGCYRGRFVAMEAKRPGKNPTRLQEYMLGRITAAGGVTAVIRSVDDARAVIDRVELLLEDQEPQPLDSD